MADALITYEVERRVWRPLNCHIDGGGAAYFPSEGVLETVAKAVAIGPTAIGFPTSDKVFVGGHGTVTLRVRMPEHLREDHRYIEHSRVERQVWGPKSKEGHYGWRTLGDVQHSEHEVTWSISDVHSGQQAFVLGVMVERREVERHCGRIPIEFNGNAFTFSVPEGYVPADSFVHVPRGNSLLTINLSQEVNGMLSLERDEENPLRFTCSIGGSSSA